MTSSAAARDETDAKPTPRAVLDIASSPVARNDGETREAPVARPLAPDPDHPADRPAADPAVRKPSRLGHFAVSLGKTVLTLLILLVAAVGALVIWDYYVVAPWTRDGRIRVQVASIAPQVSGQITELRVGDNQYVHKGDVLYVIDPFDFQVSLESAQTTLRMKAADLQVKRAQSERRQKLTDLATTPEEQQQYSGNAVQAQAAFEAAQQQVNQAEINLKRTRVMSPVDGYVTNLLMRVGDYAHAGTSNLSVIDAHSYWVDGYFEETKMARVCVGDRAEAQLMGYRRPILGTVSSVTRGISVSDAAPSTQGLPSVDPVYTWVRLAQRVPVRIDITDVPPGVPLVSGMTATVTLLDSERREGDGWFQQRLSELRQRLDDLLHRPQPAPNCVPVIGVDSGTTSVLPTPEAPKGLTPSEINPGLTPGLNVSPRLPP